jgi:protein gp37
MSQTTKIEWTDATYSPIRARVKQDAAEIARQKGYTSLIQIGTKMAGRVGQHCEHVSPGCENCYSGNDNKRCLPGNGTGLPFDRRSRDLVEVFLDRKKLREPLCWRKPKKIFVENQSDLFGEWVPDGMIDQVFDVMPQRLSCVFQVLTKRADRMRDFISRRSVRGQWPLTNVWLGVSVESHAMLDRIDILRQIPAAIHFISFEPLLEDLGPVDLTGIDWIIIGGESGPGARKCDLEWVRSLVVQAKALGVGCFVKQLGAKPFDLGVRLKLRHRKGGDPDAWPADLRVREFPAR